MEHLLARAAELVVAAGPTVVFSVPRYAKEAGARLVVVDAVATRLDHVADVVIPGRAGDVMPRLAAHVASRAGRAGADACRAAGPA